jgi:predicted Zn-dependent protease
MERKEFREASFYATKLTEQCPDSVKHMVMKIEADLCFRPNDMTDPIKFTTNIQERFIERPEFLFWRGRVLLYNGQTDMGKKHVRQALNIDPDNAQIMRFWKSLSTMESKKQAANEAQQQNNIA